MPGGFLDTNGLLYLATDGGVKADRAEELLAAGGVMSVQVLNELANVARRRMRLSWTETHGLLDVPQRLLTIQPVTPEIHETALRVAERYGFSVHDAMTVAAALHAGCDRLWSEDMRDGLQVEETVRIANPFRDATSSAGS